MAFVACRIGSKLGRGAKKNKGNVEYFSPMQTRGIASIHHLLTRLSWVVHVLNRGLKDSVS